MWRRQPPRNPNKHLDPIAWEWFAAQGDRVMVGSCALDHLDMEVLGREWIRRLPSRSAGLVTIDAAAPQAGELLLAAMLRDGCAVIGNAVTAANCDAVMDQLDVRQTRNPVPNGGLFGRFICLLHVFC